MLRRGLEVCAHSGTAERNGGLRLVHVAPQSTRRPHHHQQPNMGRSRLWKKNKSTLDEKEREGGILIEPTNPFCFAFALCWPLAAACCHLAVHVAE